MSENAPQGEDEHRQGSLRTGVRAPDPVAGRTELLHFALNRVHEAAFLADRTARFVYVNEEACRSLGYTQQELLQMTVVDVDVDFDFTRWDEVWSALKRVGSLTIESLHRRKDGSRFPVEINVSQFAFGGEEYNLALARDVTERRRAETLLRESERRYRQIFDNVSDVLFLASVDAGRRFPLIEINAACESAFGITRTEMIGRPVDEAMPAALAGTLHDAFVRCVAVEAAIEQELTLEVGGEPRYFHATLMPVRGGDGRIARIAGIARDTTGSVRTKALLVTQLELEAQFRRLAENTPDIICRYDRDCRLVYANSELVATLGKPLQDLLGRRPLDRMSAPGYADYQQALYTCLETGIEQQVELTLADLGHGTRHHHIRIIPERGPNRAVTGVLALGRDITERKRAEERLHASEQAFRAVVEHTPDYIARYDRDYRRIYANPALQRIVPPIPAVPLDPIQASESPVIEFAQYVEWLRQVIESGAEIVRETRFRDGRGEVRWGHVRLVPEFMTGGAVGSVLAICRDVDELKRSEERFRTLTENFPDFIARFDPACRHLYVNPLVANSFGMPQDAFVGKRLHEIQPVDQREQNAVLEEGIRRAVEEGQSNEVEASWEIDGQPHVFEIRHVPEKDSEGKVVSVLGIAHDITRLRTAETALRASEAAFRTLAENAPDIIVRYDREFRCVYANPEFERISGLEAGEAAGKTLMQLPVAPLNARRALRQKLHTVMESGVPEKIDLTWEHDGRLASWYVRAVPEYDAAGGIESVLTIWSDITDRMDAERRLRESYALLSELTSRRETAREEERKRIAREIHDELGQHLTALRMGVSTFGIEFGSGHPAIAARVQGMLGIADDTMKVVRNVITLLRPAVLDEGIVAALEWLTREFSRASQIACRLIVPSGEVELDDERATALFRITQEALTNVMRHAGAASACVALRERDAGYELEVRDDGRGFDPGEARRTSFGLIGMKERALMLGGEIDVHSSPGHGTQITVRLPARAVPQHSGSGSLL